MAGSTVARAGISSWTRGGRGGGVAGEMLPPPTSTTAVAPGIRAARKRGLRQARWARIIYHRTEKLKANRRSPTDVD